jgi:hypothetical protein
MPTRRPLNSFFLLFIALVALTGCGSKSSNQIAIPTCQEGGTCKLGDTGPGGGIIFLVDSDDRYAGFTYLEIKYEDILDVSGDRLIATMCSEQFIYLAPKSNEIGRGKMNSEELSRACSTSAASFVKKFSQNSLTDWYLPTSDELQLAYKVLAVNGQLSFSDQTNGIGFYCSSSYSDPDISSFEDSLNIGVVLDPRVLGIGGTAAKMSITQPCAVRPVRSFG